MAAFRVLLIALALTAPVWALNAMPAHACSCVADANWLAENSPLILTGTPRETTILDASVGQSYQALAETLIEVEEYVKGTGPDELRLKHVARTNLVDGIVTIVPGLGPTCGYAPDLHIRHVFTTFQSEDGEPRLSGCTSFAFLPDSTFANDLLTDIRQALNEAEEPVELPPTGSSEASEGGSRLALAVAGILLAASASAVLAMLRRRVS